MLRILPGRPFHLNEISNRFIQGRGGGGRGEGRGAERPLAVCINQPTTYQCVGTLILVLRSNQISSNSYIIYSCPACSVEFLSGIGATTLFCRKRYQNGKDNKP